MKFYQLSFLWYIPIISGLFFQLSCNRAPAFPQASQLPVSLQTLKTDKAAVANLVFSSADGGQTWQDIREGLPGKPEEGGFILSRKIRICQVFYRQDPGRHEYFCCTNFKRIRKIKEMP